MPCFAYTCLRTQPNPSNPNLSYLSQVKFQETLSTLTRISWLPHVQCTSFLMYHSRSNNQCEGSVKSLEIPYMSSFAINRKSGFVFHLWAKIELRTFLHRPVSNFVHLMVPTTHSTMGFLFCLKRYLKCYLQIATCLSIIFHPFPGLYFFKPIKSVPLCEEIARGTPPSPLVFEGTLTYSVHNLLNFRWRKGQLQYLVY